MSEVPSHCRPNSPEMYMPRPLEPKVELGAVNLALTEA
jgi:hypothetical protein